MPERTVRSASGRSTVQRHLVAGVAVVALLLFSTIWAAPPSSAGSSIQVSNCTGSASPVRRWVTFAHIRALFRCDTGADSEFGIRHFEPDARRSAYSRLLFRSTEGSRKWAASAYQLFLGRQPDAGGSAFWKSHLHAGTRYDAFESTLIGSNEYFNKIGATNPNFVDAVYNDLLDRSPHGNEVSYWVNRLATGSTRTGVALTIDRSPERRRIIASTWGYAYVLHRTSVTTADLNYWVAQQAAGLDQLDLSAAFTASAEAVADASAPGF